jgi:OFA family oxalate/formate antiporter-like MFS transporter
MRNKSPFFYGYIIVIISFLIMMVILGLQTSFGIFFKPIIETLGLSGADARTVTSGAFSLSQIVGGISCIVIGGLNDRFGPRVSVTLCGIVSLLGYFLMSQVQEVWQLYLYYGVLIGAGIGVFVPVLSTVAKWFFHRRSLMSGIAFAGTGFGMLIFPPIVNWLLATYDWRVTFIVLALIILAGSILSAIFLRSDPGKLGQVAYGENDAKAEGTNTGKRSYTLKEAIATRQFWLFCIVLLGYGFCFFALDVHIAPYATDTGISAAGAAMILSILGGATIVGQIGLGSAGDRIGYKRAFLIGIICIVIATFVLMVFKQLWAFYLAAILLGLAFGNCSTQESPIAAWLFGLASHGIILGICAFSFTIGAAIGPLVFGYIFDVTGQYQYAFWITAVLAIVTAVLTVAIKQIVTNSATSTAGIK